MEMSDDDATMIGKRILSAIEHDGVFGLGLLAREIKAGFALVKQPRAELDRDPPTAKRCTIAVRGEAFVIDERVISRAAAIELVVRCRDVQLPLPSCIEPVELDRYSRQAALNWIATVARGAKSSG